MPRSPSCTAEGKLFTVILRDVTERGRAEEDLAPFATEASDPRTGKEPRRARAARRAGAVAHGAQDGHRLGAGEPAVTPGVGATRRRCWKCSTPPWRSAPHRRRPAADDAGRPGARAGHRVAGAELRATHRHPVRTGCGRGVGAARTLCDGRVSHRAGVAGERGKAFEGHAGQRRHRAQRQSSCCSACGTTASGSRADAAPQAAFAGPCGLRERAQLLKGTISVHSQPGEGTTVEARIPVGEPGESD